MVRDAVSIIDELNQTLIDTIGVRVGCDLIGNLLNFGEAIDIKCLESYQRLALASDLNAGLDCFQPFDFHRLTSNSFSGYGALSPSPPSTHLVPMDNHPAPFIASMHYPSCYFENGGESFQYSLALAEGVHAYPCIMGLTDYNNDFAINYDDQGPLRSKRKSTPPSQRTASLKPKTIPCLFPGCTRVFSRQYNMRAHLEIHSTIRTKNHVCPECGRPFSRRHDMYRHQRNIHRDKWPKPSTPELDPYKSRPLHSKS
ncbi:hypothetical protein L0F63_001448 [Massospora cicadina]|nr:hypothetical protein L0F63_001448 [Massospora cicadina]